MAQVLELFDVTGEQDVATGDTATLLDSGRVVFEGRGVAAIFAPWLKERDPQEVFRKMIGWSNGYVALKERK